MPKYQTVASKKRAKARREAYAKKKQAEKKAEANRATAVKRIASRPLKSGDAPPPDRVVKALKTEQARGKVLRDAKDKKVKSRRTSERLRRNARRRGQP